MTIQTALCREIFWGWSPFTPLERERIVDLMEQRLGLDLRPARYAASIGAIATRMVSVVREDDR